jgi:BirA family biotin operon repressor/biotin-[acetyl-CoA-carboxylase] ligase
MNSLSFSVLRALADGNFHSGAALAQTLGVSRGTIWNAIRAIERAGLEVYKVRARGYRLPRQLSLLAAETVLDHLGAAAPRFTMDVQEMAASTNTLLLKRIAAGARSGEVIAAEWQTQGRGRFGRAWHAGPCGALTFSLAWRFAQGAAALAGLSLAVGVALSRALHKIGANEVRLKWPNDLVWRGRKLAGILIEMQGDALGPSAVAIGVGLNVRLSTSVLEAIDQPVVDLESICDLPLDRNRILAALLVELADVLDQFSVEGFGPLQPEWERYHAYQGEQVRANLPNGTTVEGIARGVADDGALLLETPTRVERLHSGEVSVRASRREPAAA